MVTKANKHIQRRQRKCGRPPISAEIVRQVIKALEVKPPISLGKIAGTIGISRHSVSHIKKDYAAGLYDSDGFRYPAPLLRV